MQLEDASIRPYLHADIVPAWDVEGLRPDRQRVANAAEQYPKARVELQGGASQPTGGGAASREAILPHTYHIIGSFRYSDILYDTVNEAAIAYWNLLVARLTASYPLYNNWKYEEEIGWDFEDNPTEETFTVTVIFTLSVVSRVRTLP